MVCRVPASCAGTRCVAVRPCRYASLRLKRRRAGLPRHRVCARPRYRHSQVRRVVSRAVAGVGAVVRHRSHLVHVDRCHVYRFVLAAGRIRHRHRVGRVRVIAAGPGRQRRRLPSRSRYRIAVGIPLVCVAARPRNRDLKRRRGIIPAVVRVVHALRYTEPRIHPHLNT